MSGLRQSLVRQFVHPSGVLGRVAGFIMERRPSNRRRNLWTLELLELRPDDDVLEIGFGPGFALERSAGLASRGRIVGVDHSELMVSRAARRHAAAITAGRVELHCARAEDLPVPETSFDKAFAVNVSMFWRDPVAVLERILAALRPGGRVALTHQPRNPGATHQDTVRSAERIAANLRAAGFDDVRVEFLELKPVSAACVMGTRPSRSLDRG